MIEARQAAINSDATTYSMLVVGGNWEFTNNAKQSMMNDLDCLREMLTQMGFHKNNRSSKNYHESDEWYFYVSRIAISAMQMYLSGTLEKVDTESSKKAPARVEREDIDKLLADYQDKTRKSITTASTDFVMGTFYNLLTNQDNLSYEQINSLVQPLRDSLDVFSYYVLSSMKRAIEKDLRIHGQEDFDKPIFKHKTIFRGLLPEIDKRLDKFYAEDED